MRFAFRDDDLNFYFDPIHIKNYYSEIWDICPITMSVIPFIYGDWPSYSMIAEKYGSSNLPDMFYEILEKNTECFPIGENIDLINFLKQQILCGRINLSLHGISHIKLHDDLKFENNFSHGAEFYTSRDLTVELKKSITYLENLFNIQIRVFTPPQNLLSDVGLNSILKNKLAICSDLPSLRSLKSVKNLGVHNYFKLFLHRVFNKNYVFPFTLISKKSMFVDHVRLQPNSDLDKIFEQIEFVYRKNGVFVLSTHSYAFDLKMNNYDFNLHTGALKVINYIKKKNNVKFVTLTDIFENV